METIEPNNFFSAEKLAKMATCDECARKVGRRRDVPKEPEPRQVKMPYAD